MRQGYPLAFVVGARFQQTDLVAAHAAHSNDPSWQPPSGTGAAVITSTGVLDASLVITVAGMKPLSDDLQVRLAACCREAWVSYLDILVHPCSQICVE